MSEKSKLSTLSKFCFKLGCYIALYSLVSSLLQKPIIPPIPQILNDVPRFFGKEILDDIYATYFRWMAVFFLGVGFATGAGLILSYFPKVAQYLSFDVDFWRSLPATALVAFFFALMGDNSLSRIAPALYITIFTTLFYILKASGEINRNRMLHLKALGASNSFIISKWYLHEMIPSIIVAARQSVSLSFLVLISSELIVGSSGDVGLGNRLVDWFFYADYEKVIIAFIFLGLSGYSANIFVKFLLKKLILKYSGRKNVLV